MGVPLLIKFITFDFLTFRLSLFAFSHSVTWTSSSLSVFCTSNIPVSSANSKNCSFCDESIMSFMYIRKSSGRVASHIYKNIQEQFKNMFFKNQKKDILKF